MPSSNQYLRFPLAYRIEHWVLAIGFTVLAITGLAQMFAESVISQYIVGALRGVENVRLIHHAAAIVLVAQAIIHLGAVQYRIFVRGHRLDLLPGVGDIVTAIQALLYNTGLTQEVPKEGRFTFAEKAEYWAVIWGTIIMAITGFMMWNPITTAHVVPGEWILGAKAAHGAEAILAVLAIIIWHFYYTLVKDLNKSMFTGYLTEEQMECEHAMELADIKAGICVPAVDPRAVARWRRVGLPVYLAITGVVLLGVFYLSRFEKTTTGIEVPPENVTIFSPELASDIAKAELPPPLAGGAAPTWNNGIGAILKGKCGTCHGSPLLMGNMNLTTYQGAMAGGTDKVILTGNPDRSLLVRKVEGGGHPGRLSDLQMVVLKAWIKSGAPEGEIVPGVDEWTPPPVPGIPMTTQSSTASPELAPGESVTWENQVGAIFTARCGSCHGGPAPMMGLNLTTYAGAMKAITPGNPDGSSVIRKAGGGGHPGHFSSQELDIIKAWITAGAPGIKKAEPAPAPVVPKSTATASALTWNDGIGSILSSNCGACHNGGTRIAGLDLTSYKSALGKAGVIVPGDPSGSKLVQKMEAGGHPGKMTSEQLDQVKGWIQAGAPESGGLASPAPEPSEPATEPVTPENTGTAPIIIEVKPGPSSGGEGTSNTGASSDPTWDNSIAEIFKTSCTMCHNSTNATAGLDLSTYQGAMAGGTDQKVIIPNDPDASMLVTKMEAGGHPGHLSEENLALVRKWIEGGAVEKAEAVSENPTEPLPAETGVSNLKHSWNDDIGRIFADNCTMCHNTDSKVGGLDLSTYSGAMAGGADKVIDPNDPDDSLLLKKMEEGGHPGSLTDDQLASVKEWIEEGAPETKDVASVAEATPTPAQQGTWVDSIGAIFKDNCTMCHNPNAKVAGLDLSTYIGAIAGGSVKVIVPGDPDKSEVIRKVQGGHHPGQLSEEQLESIRQWILNGAPEK